MQNKIAIIIVILFAVASCKKENSSSGLIKSITVVAPPDTILNLFTYDNEQRIIAAVTVTGISSLFRPDTTTFSYAGSSVIQRESGGYTVTYQLNSMGYRQSDDIGDTWSYNSMGYLTASKGGGYNTIYNYNSQQQLVSQIQISPDDSLGFDTITDTYTYSNNPFISSFVLNSLNGFPAVSANWVTGKVTNALWSTDTKLGNGGSLTTTCAYSTDSQNRLSEIAVAYNNQLPNPEFIYFTYY